MGAPLATQSAHPPALYAWTLWTFGELVALALVGGIATLLDAIWAFLYKFELAPPRALEELLLNGLLAVGLSLPQYILIRWVTGNQSNALAAWVPTTVAVLLCQDVVSIFWLRDAPNHIAIVAGVLFGVLLVLSQGFLMAEIVGRRRAGVLWVLATTVFAALSYLIPAGTLYGAFSGVNVVVAAIVELAIVGGIYGGITGVAFVASLRSSLRAPAPAAR